MVKLLGMAILLFTIVTVKWENNFEIAKQKAATENKFILLHFSGSDWCGKCQQMEKNYFETSAFKSFADSNLIMLKADFPRLKKNQLTKEQKKANENLADKYKFKGSFPYSILLDSTGKVLKKWEGLPGIKVADFILQMQEIKSARK